MPKSLFLRNMDMYAAKSIYDRYKKPREHLGDGADQSPPPTSSSPALLGLIFGISLFFYAAYLSWTSNALVDIALQRFTLQNSAGAGPFVNFFKALAAGGSSTMYLLYYYFSKLHTVRDIRARLLQP